MDKEKPDQLVHLKKKFKYIQPVDVELKLNVSVTRNDIISDRKGRPLSSNSSISGTVIKRKAFNISMYLYTLLR